MEHLDWQANRTQHECTKYMLEHQINCDVNFIVGEEREVIRAHKFILSMRSPVFDRMFNGGYQEADEDPVIPDICPETFKAVLRYCYYDCLEIPFDMALSTMYAAKKYILPILENHAREVLISTLSASNIQDIFNHCETNIWDIFEYSITIGDDDLRACCRKYFVGDVQVVRLALIGRRFHDLPLEVLQAFLHLNDSKDNPEHAACKGQGQNNPGVSISEIELFKACTAWAEAECLRQEIDPTGANKRTVLGECLFLIRFPTMLYEDLVNEVFPSDILSETEKVNLFQYKHKTAMSDCCYVGFPTDERQIMAKPMKVPHAYSQSPYLDTHSPARSFSPPISPLSLPFSPLNFLPGFGPSSPVIKTVKSTILIMPDERIQLSKIWTKASWNTTKVIIQDKNTDRTLLTRTPLPQHEAYVEGNSQTLVCCDIEPLILQPGSRYAVTVEASAKAFIPSAGPRPTGPFITVKQVHIERVSGTTGCIYGVTLCLV